MSKPFHGKPLDMNRRHKMLHPVNLFSQPTMLLGKAEVSSRQTTSDTISTSADTFSRQITFASERSDVEYSPNRHADETPTCKIAVSTDDFWEWHTDETHPENVPISTDDFWEWHTDETHPENLAINTNHVDFWEWHTDETHPENPAISIDDYWEWHSYETHPCNREDDRV